MISIHFQGKPFNIMVTQVSDPPQCSRCWSWTVLWRPTRPSRTNSRKKKNKKKMYLSSQGTGKKNRKSRDTWSNRQVWPWSKKWNKTKVKRVLTRELIGYKKHPIIATQEMAIYMDITRWSVQKLGWLYFLQPKMEKFYTVSKNKTGSWMWLRSQTPYCKIQT